MVKGLNGLQDQLFISRCFCSRFQEFELFFANLIQPICNLKSNGSMTCHSFIVRHWIFRILKDIRSSVTFQIYRIFLSLFDDFMSFARLRTMKCLCMRPPTAPSPIDNTLLQYSSFDIGYSKFSRHCSQNEVKTAIVEETKTNLSTNCQECFLFF